MLDPNYIDYLVREKSKFSIGDEWLDRTYQSCIHAVGERLHYYRFLYYLVEWRKPKVCLEIGVEFGVASAHMAAAASLYGGYAIGVDLHSHGIPAFEIPAQYKNYELIVGDSTSDGVYQQVLELVEENGPIGVVFQDSSHHIQASRKEWELYSALLDEDAVWIADDVMPCFHDPKVDPPGVSMVDYFNERPGRWKTTYPDILHHGNIVGILLV